MTGRANSAATSRRMKMLSASRARRCVTVSLSTVRTGYHSIMLKSIKIAVIAGVVVCCAAGQDISADRIRAHVKFLASDLLEGRGVGARGGELATEYIATQFALAGAQPAGDNGTYFQR